jgi:hypothetical protein
MTHIPYRAGQEIEVEIDGAKSAATVSTYRIIGNSQIMTVKDCEGRSITLAAKLPKSPDGLAPIIAVQPDMTEARRIALASLAGGQGHMPVTAQLNVLAMAVLALTGGAA